MYRKSLALTFDDGPDNGMMYALMELLNRYDAKATFFVQGSKVHEDTAAVLKAAVAQGYEIGNHSENHLHLPRLPLEQMGWEMEQVQKKVERMVGVTPVLFRPPYLDADERTLACIRMPFIFGAANGDWDPACTVDQRVSRALRDACDGAILLMHCFEGNEDTVAALEQLLPELKRQGYRITTVSGLFRDKGIRLEPGRIYDKAARGEGKI